MEAPSRRLLFASAACGLAAALTWAAVALHQLRAHGATQVNEMRIVAGVTWMDSAKILPLALLLLVPGLLCVVRRARADGSRRAALVGRVVAVLVAVSAVGGAVDFWTFPTGVRLGLVRGVARLGWHRPVHAEHAGRLTSRGRFRAFRRMRCR